MRCPEVTVPDRVETLTAKAREELVDSVGREDNVFVRVVVKS